MRRESELNTPIRQVFMAAALLVAGLTSVQAQSWPAYTVAKLNPVMGSNGKAQDTTVWALNNNGTVVGWTAQPAGTKTVYSMTFNAIGFPNIFGPYDVSKVYAFTTSPVTWSAGSTQPKLLPRYAGLYNTLARDILDDGAILMEVADVSGKTTSMSGRLQGDEKSHWRLYRANAFKTPMINGARMPVREVDDKWSAYFGPAGELVYHAGPTDIRIWSNDAARQVMVPSPDGVPFTKVQLKGLLPGSQGWVSTEAFRTDPATRLGYTGVGCQKGALGQFEQQIKEAGAEQFQCHAMNRNGVVFGTALKRVQVWNEYGSHYDMQPTGHYMIQGTAWTRVALMDGKRVFGPVFMDEQGRVVTQATDFVGEQKIRPVLILPSGEARPLQEVANAPIGEKELFTFADMNDKGQILIQLLGLEAGRSSLLLTPQ